MNWMEVSVLTTHEAAEAVGNIFHEMKVGGIVIEDPVLINQLRDREWELTDIPEQTDLETVTISAYLPGDDNFYGKLKEIEAALLEIEKNFSGCKRATTKFREVCEEDWANAWKQYFHPTRVSEHIVIKPTWEDYTPSVDDIVVELDPGMAFGTGTHHTTTLCIQEIERVLTKDMTVFDVGTGSGILAVIAAKLGAAQVTAVDIDTVAVRVAKENIILNKTADKVSAAQGDLLTGVQGQADLIIANIIADIIIRVLPDVLLKLKPGGIFLASGIIVDRLEDVAAKALELGLNVDKVTERCGWVVMQFSRKDD